MSTLKQESGFTAVELLITLFVASAFVIAGYQLYAVIIKDGINTRAQSTASNLAYSYLRQYSGSTTTPCTSQTPLTNSAISVTGLSNVTMTVAITCPYTATTAVSEVRATIQYNIPQQTISNAVYVTQ